MATTNATATITVTITKRSKGLLEQLQRAFGQAVKPMPLDKVTQGYVIEALLQAASAPAVGGDDDETR